MTKTRKRQQEEYSPLQVAALFCVVVGVGQLAATYYGTIDLIGGYASGIIILAAGVTLFAFDKAPDETLGILKAFLNFVHRIFKIFVDFVKSLLSKE